MGNKLLTIGIAAYNVDKYISRTLDSIVKSSHIDNLEIIVVNDGSTDTTYGIAEEYSKKHPESIIVINKDNAGHGSCINTAIKHSTGKYFRLLDGDDSFDTEEFDEFLSKLKNCDSDLVLTPYARVNDTLQVFNITGKNYNDYYRNVLENEIGIAYDKIINLFAIHSMTFKSSILKNNNIFIDENSFYVDRELVLFPLPFLDDFMYFDNAVYQYRVGRDGQSMNVKSLIKNVKMHKNIIFRLHSAYMRLSLTPNKKLVFARLICSNIRTQILIYFNMIYSLTTYNELKAFAEDVRKFERKEYDFFKINRLIIEFPFLYFFIHIIAKGVSID